MFREAFKFYKAKWPTPNLDGVVDVDIQTESGAAGRFRVLDLNTSLWHSELSLPVGLKPFHIWRCYELPERPGLILIRNPFSVRGQRYWMARCLRDYPRHPNIVNLNEHLFTTASIRNWWHELQNCKDKDESRRLKIAMRWTTLGYHHDWDTKVYSELKCTQFPSDLNQLCQYFGEVLGYKDFVAQAAIVNYYPIGATLAGHTDRSELDLEAPLFSFSFGQTAIFLIGGHTKQEQPTAVYLRSGDVLIMSKKSRLCYHAVPRVMKARDEPWNEIVTNSVSVPDSNQLKNGTEQPLKKQRRDNNELENATIESSFNMALYEQVVDEHFWLPFKQYLNDSRINVNVRQVLSKGQTHLYPIDSSP